MRKAFTKGPGGAPLRCRQDGFAASRFLGSRGFMQGFGLLVFRASTVCLGLALSGCRGLELKLSDFSVSRLKAGHWDSFCSFPG